MYLFDSREADFFCNNFFLNDPYLHSWKAVIDYCGDVHVDHLIVNTRQPLLTSRFNYSSFMSISSLSSSQSQVIRYSTCPRNKDAILPCLIPHTILWIRSMKSRDIITRFIVMRLLQSVAKFLF